MREIMQELKELQSKEGGCVPNLQGVSLVGRDKGCRSDAAVGRSRPGQAMSWVGWGSPWCGQATPAHCRPR